MTELAATRTALAARIAAVPGVGAVHDRERYADQTRRLTDLYTVDPATPGAARLLRGWFVAFRARRTSARRGRALVERDWEVIGFVGFDDAAGSEHLAGDLAEAVIAAIAADRTLGGTAARLLGPLEDGDGTPALVELAPVSFAGVVAHRIRIVLTTEHFA